MKNSTIAPSISPTAVFLPWLNTSNSRHKSHSSDTYCNELGITDKVVGGVVYGVFSLFGSLGNIFVILVICRTPNLRSICGLFITNLAIADLLTTTLVNVLYFYAHVPYSSCENRTVLHVSQTIGFISVAASLSTLTFLSIDRCFAVCSPLNHKTFMTFTKLRVIFVKIWIDSLVLPILHAIYPNNRVLTYIPGSCFIVCFFIIFTSGVITVLKVRKNSSTIRDLRQSQNASRISTDMRKRSKATAKTMALVVLFLALSWTPYTVMTMLTVKHYSLGFWFHTLGFENSAVNPCIYFYRHRNYLQALKAIFRRSSPPS